jgi:hypothetical protein
MPSGHDLSVVGCIFPSLDGYYDIAGIYNGEPYYDRFGSATGRIFKSMGGDWNIVLQQQFDTGSDYFVKEGDELLGSYSPEGDAYPNPIVSVGPVASRKKDLLIYDFCPGWK